MLDKKRNSEDRIKFISFWADYIKKSHNKIWSSQHSSFINSVLKSADQNAQLYMKVKNSTKNPKCAKRKRYLKIDRNKRNE